MPNSIHALSATVRGRRRELGLSQAELASRAMVSRKWVYEFEAGKPKAELGLLLQVLDALDLRLEVGVAGRGQAPASTDAVDLDALLDEHRAT